MSLVFIAISAVWAWWIARSIHTRADLEAGQSIVRYGPGIRALAIVGWLVAVGLTILSFVEPGFFWWGRLILSGCAFFVAAVLHTEFYCSNLRYDATGVHVISPWRADRVVGWDDFSRAYFHTGKDAYVLESTSHGNIEVHRYMSGIESLLDELARHGVPIDPDA